MPFSNAKTASLLMILFNSSIREGKIGKNMKNQADKGALQ
jgi:hypothetical protein